MQIRDEKSIFEHSYMSMGFIRMGGESFQVF